jgi:hypothetical protein
MAMLLILALNVMAVLFLVLTGSDKNIESRTEREENILKKDKK